MMQHIGDLSFQEIVQEIATAPLEIQLSMGIGFLGLVVCVLVWRLI